jgi:hypothetical protein
MFSPFVLHRKLRILLEPGCKSTCTQDGAAPEEGQNGSFRKVLLEETMLNGTHERRAYEDKSAWGRDGFAEKRAALLLY